MLYGKQRGGDKVEIKRVTIKIPFDLWVKLRRLTETGEVKSIQEAVIRGIKCVLTHSETE